jgi:hypothetical protein
MAYLFSFWIASSTRLNGRFTCDFDSRPEPT